MGDIDRFSKHEVLDRTYIILEQFNSSILDHEIFDYTNGAPKADVLKDIITQAIKVKNELRVLYNKLGSYCTEPCTDCELCYTVTMLDTRLAQPTPHCIAWEPTKKGAIQIVETNDMDISDDGLNQYAIIESVAKGVGWDRRHEPYIQWYEWDQGTKKYVACATPDKWTNVVRWGMG